MLLFSALKNIDGKCLFVVFIFKVYVDFSQNGKLRK